MERTILKYAPSSWDHIEDNREYLLGTSSEEYRIIEYQIKRAAGHNRPHINCIRRYQNIHDYGQFLIREQLLAVSKPHEQFYRVCRYITIRRQFLTSALKYNLDHRRCGLASLVFQKNITCGSNNIILVVQVVTNTPNTDHITPSNSSDYFIDYIVYL